MPLPDDLLTPLPGDQRCGADLRYDPLYDKIKEARREDDDAPQGEWERQRKVADWPLVIKLASEALAKRTKDLQLASWLTEALLRREGYPGLANGLRLVHGLIEGFWECLYPEIEDGDLELRVAPVEWLGTRMNVAAKLVPLSTAGHHYLQYQESRAVPSEADAEQDEGKGAARQTAIDEGKLTPEEFDQGFVATPKAWYRQLESEVASAQEGLEALNTLGRERFGADAPSVIPLRDALEEVQRAVRALLARKLVADPDPVDATAMAGGLGSAGGPAAGGATAPGGLPAEPVDRGDAIARILGAARFLRRTDPISPVSYLVLRVLRWGELRSQGAELDPRLLEAPPSQARTQLKGLLLDQDWPQLLEAAESIMATPAGRGWLDLQRYALNACAGMGQDYDVAVAGIRGELRRLLNEIPGLLEMTLMDDMPTAGPSTITWLREEGLVGEAGAEAAEPQTRAPSPAATPMAVDRLLERALAEVRGGRPQQGIELLKRELDRERSPRGRFLRQVQLAKVMLAAGLESVAAPTLEQLVAQVDAHNLEGWEAGAVVAEPLALLYRCLHKTGGDPAVMQTLFLRISRLDPMQAIAFGEMRSDGEGGA